MASAEAEQIEDGEPAKKKARLGGRGSAGHDRVAVLLLDSSSR